MCGIAGIITANGLRGRTFLHRFAVSLAHRGPDGVGRFATDRVEMLNTRLAIVDLETGNQPFQSADGLALVANGEIYNDCAIRRSLDGARFQTKCDCESPLHLYRKKGLDAFDELRGMYSIAIYDPGISSLVLSRDPFGIKPLYLASAEGEVAFASEPQVLIKAGLAKRKIDPQKRSELLQLKFTTGRQTIFPGIERLLPGETIVVRDGQIVERRRRRLFSAEPPETVDGDPVNALNAIITESVEAHLRCDVSYGLFLSGGIDSSALLAAMACVSPRPIRAFTATFPGSNAADESEAARRVAKAAGADHELVALTREDFWRLSAEAAAVMDDPTTDAAVLPTFKLAERAGLEGVKVVLSGEGGDEIFGGYSRYRRAAWLNGLLARRSRTRGVFDGLTKEGTNGPFSRWRDGLAQTERECVDARWSQLQRLQAIDCAEWLPNDLLNKLDRCLMAHGVEGRTPFLDPLVGRFAFGLPDRLKVKGTVGKIVLRQWLSKVLPGADAFARKTGFNPPVGEWIGSYKANLEKLVPAQPGIREMAIPDIVRQTLAAPEKHAQAAWSLVFYALWHSHHILGVSPHGSIADVLSEAANSG